MYYMQRRLWLVSSGLSGCNELHQKEGAGQLVWSLTDGIQDKKNKLVKLIAVRSWSQLKATDEHSNISVSFFSPVWIQAAGHSEDTLSTDELEFLHTPPKSSKCTVKVATFSSRY